MGIGADGSGLGLVVQTPISNASRPLTLTNAVSSAGAAGKIKHWCLS
jgi:hypothetical protein